MNIYHDDKSVIALHKGRQTVFEQFEYVLIEEGHEGEGSGAIVVPMHGKIISITVADGDVVEEGDILFSVEAMKMEHAVLAPFDGIVEKLSIDTGTQVEAGQMALQVSGVVEA